MPDTCFSSQREGFPNLGSPEPAIDHFVEKSKKIGQIDPKSTIQTACIQPTIHQRIVPLDHHETLAFQTIHNP
jgi:hypothetical protein